MNASSNGEVYGTNTLYAAMVVGAVALLLASLWSPATTAPVQGQTAAPTQQMVVTAAEPGHVS